METSARSRLRVQRAGSATVPGDGRASTARRPAAVEQLRDGSEAGSPTLRVAILDSDSGFLVVLAKRLERLGWKHRMLSARVTTKTLASMDVDALIIDIAILGA